MTDATAYVEVLARLLCAADVHVHGGDHPSWQQLPTRSGRGQDDYRKAARWLADRLTVTRDARTAAAPVTPEPADRAAVPSAAVRKTLRRWAYAAGHIESELDGAVDRMYELVARDVLRRMADETPAAEGQREPDQDCDRCDGSGLDPDAFFREGDTWTHAPCSACLPEEDEAETPAERVKHSGPDTKFCVLCLSGEHERIEEE
ncbi:hypothetical protein ACTWJ9_33095 (plasmid) [Streptomyces sp. GDS52]|uniref:hypothetical protein n=1 Tax=Streptomyces sp. GDS52 TaxID=3406419 RepID=UPI003FD663F6